MTKHKNLFSLVFSPISCGVNLLSDVCYISQDHAKDHTALRAVSDVYHGTVLSSYDGEVYHNRKTAMIVFSDNDVYKGGHALAAYVTEHKLGSIIEAGPERNPNSGRQIRTWVWTLDYEAMGKHLEAASEQS